MGATSTVLLGFLGCGGVAALVYFASSLLGKKSSNMLESVFQGKGIENLQGIEGDQKLLAKKIGDQEKISVQAQERIKTIQKKASTEIEEVLKNDSISSIQDSIDNDWDKI